VGVESCHPRLNAYTKTAAKTGAGNSTPITTKDTVRPGSCGEDKDELNPLARRTADQEIAVTNHTCHTRFESNWWSRANPSE
jgi:hypothetical protein